MIDILLAFLIAQIINVILKTLKSVITIKGGRNLAAISSAISYGFNTFIIKSIVEIDLQTALIITMISNLIGVYLSLYILEKVRKDQLWKITVSVPTNDLKKFKKELLDNKIDFIAYQTSWEEYKVVDIFSKERAESSVVKKIFKNFKVKYTISENSGTL